MDKRLAIIVSTRPDIIKMSPIIRYCKKNNINHSLIHTGQHYDPEMDSIFFKDLDLPKPDINIKSSFETAESTDQTATIMNKIKGAIIEEKISIVMVLGDTSSSLAASIIARRLNLKLAHVEAGLRSFDDRMQEEHNRVMIDHISDFNFAPTETAVKNLKKENIPKEKIFLTGNTIVDAVNQNIKIAKQKSDIIKRKIRHKFILATSHRPENVDYPDRLRSIMTGLNNLSDRMMEKKLGSYSPILFPIHPRTLKRLHEFGINAEDFLYVKLMDPPGYLDFLMLESLADLIITDSGGVQEEACILKKPCVTIREYTERPETLKIGCNILAGVKSDNIVKCALKMINKKISYTNPFGDGKSAVCIMKILGEKLDIK